MLMASVLANIVSIS